MLRAWQDPPVRGRGLKRCDEARLDAWLARHERESCGPLLQYDYVMDVDNSVKCVFGRQEGAELGYNPHMER